MVGRLASTGADVRYRPTSSANWAADAYRCAGSACSEWAGHVHDPKLGPGQSEEGTGRIARSNTLPDLRYAAGPNRTAVDPVRRIAAAASAWGLNPDRDVIYLNVFPEKNDGKVPYRLAVRDVPVDGFWSVTVYTADGFFSPNDLHAYSINRVTGKKGADGAITIQVTVPTRRRTACPSAGAGTTWFASTNPDRKS